MKKLFLSLAAIGLVAGAASSVFAAELKLTLTNGRATLIAQDVPVRQILDEWARVGKTTIVNGDKLSGPPLTLQLVDRPEREVLDILLRSASGYIVGQRPVAMADASQFDKVMILPVSRGPVGVVSNTPPTQFNRPPNMMQQMPVQVADDDDPVEPPQVQPGPVAQPMPMPNVPGQFPVQQQQQQAPLTAPRPGILPAPPPGQVNPYGTPAPPGTVPPFIRPPGGPGGGPRDQL